MYEIIEYRLDENGEEKISATYCVSASELESALDYLDAMCQRGEISSYAFTPV